MYIQESLIGDEVSVEFDCGFICKMTKVVDGVKLPQSDVIGWAVSEHKAECIECRKKGGM